MLYDLITCIVEVFIFPDKIYLLIDTDCGVLSNPANGNVDISSGTSYGNTASYSCDAGFELNGVLQRTCQADSTWSSSAPTCDRLGIKVKLFKTICFLEIFCFSIAVLDIDY
jgi:hypothetical protein